MTWFRHFPVLSTADTATQPPLTNTTYHQAPNTTQHDTASPTSETFNSTETSMMAAASISSSAPYNSSHTPPWTPSAPHTSTSFTVQSPLPTSTSCKLCYFYLKLKKNPNPSLLKEHCILQLFSAELPKNSYLYDTLWLFPAPISITSLQLANVTGTSFCLSWSSPSQTLTYLVVVSMGSEVINISETSETIKEVRGLQPGILYSATVTPHAEGTQGDALHISVKTGWCTASIHQ